jgi:hypothetical protein
MAINIVYGDPLLMHVKIRVFVAKKALATCRVGGPCALQQCQRGRMPPRRSGVGGNIAAQSVDDRRGRGENHS